MRLIAILSVILLSAESRGASADFEDSDLVLTEGRQRVVLHSQVCPYAFHKTIHAVHRRGDTFYVVYGTAEMSRGWPPRSGHCGAGEEFYIRWLKVTKGVIEEEHEGRYISCFQNRDGWDIKWIDNKLVWSSSGYREAELLGKREYLPAFFSWTFDPANPEKGIVEAISNQSHE